MLIFVKLINVNQLYFKSKLKNNILQLNSQKEIVEGTCCRISTGAPLPPGANCVIPIENTSVVSKSKDEKIEHNITILEEPKLFDNIR